MTTPPRAGRWSLFDSTDIVDHKEAASLCAECPMLTACAQRLNGALDAYSMPGYGPQGTWAGKLIGSGRATRDKALMAAQEDGYTEAEARRAHNAYGNGDRSQWAILGHRVYNRLNRRARRLLARAREEAAA